MTSNKRLDT